MLAFLTEAGLALVGVPLFTRSYYLTIEMHQAHILPQALENLAMLSLLNLASFVYFFTFVI